MIMNQKSLTKLEFPKIIEMLTDHASSPGGASFCRRIKPMTDINKIITAQEQTAAAFTRIVKKGIPSFSGCYAVSDSLKRLEIGSALSAPELLRIGKLLQTTARIKSYGRHENADDQADCLDVYFEQLAPLTPLSAEIDRCILGEDEISDDASSKLKQIRRSINGMNDKIHSTMTGLLNGSMRTYLQDAIITMRGDRYCLPVKAEYRSQVNGLIHDQSATGSTLFIEPMAVVKLNNDLKELYAQEQEEIQVILARLSVDAAEYIEEIRLNYKALVELDFIFAKGALALDMNASRPVFNTEGRIRIREGRHPLLDRKKVVPISLTLGDTFDLLVITGPNTGGKTVSLKTVGLFTLMGQAGLHIPALDRSELAVFNQVYADIGDEQSIEQSLSTFSSHMTNVVSFLNHVDENSLVLFDELGAGTDPTEGAALAIAILSHLHNRGIRTMATTHYSELKVFALSTPGVENACCEFDLETLSPTYRLLIGIPGNFVDIWDNFFETVRKIIPNAPVGGVSYSPSLHKDSIVNFYREWTNAKHMPDFITINSFPYREAEQPTKMNAIRQNIDTFFSDDLAYIHSVLEEVHFPECPIVVMEWNLSFIQRNSFNDMAAKAAIMIKQMTDSLGEVDYVCYWHASDIFAGDFDAKRILNGACGLISSDGFCKPPYYALLFFKQLYNYLVERGSHYIVTKNGLDHFAIILFNNKSLNYEYYSRDESTIEMNDDQKIFSNHDALEITLTLQGVQNRDYHVRKQIFGPESGSILDEWRHLGTDLQLTLNEISYLKRCSIPHRKNETILAENKTLIIQELLQEHEVMFIQID